MSKAPLNLDVLHRTPVEMQPYPYLVMEHFVTPEYCDAITQTFPPIRQDGSFPLSAFHLDGAMLELIQALESSELRDAIAAKFDMDLQARPTTITLRGYCTLGRDGKIHKDSKDKLVTVLLYLGGDWQEGDPRGCLRILNSADRLDDYAATIAPRFGTCVIFKVTDNGWHGFEAFEGKRRALQLNYVVSQRAASKNIWRHKLAVLAKRLRQRIKDIFAL